MPATAVSTTVTVSPRATAREFEVRGRRSGSDVVTVTVFGADTARQAKAAARATACSLARESGLFAGELALTTTQVR